jgi:hypothetical protein
MARLKGSFAWSNLFLLALVFVSCLISAYDNVMSLVFWETLPENEENPLASLIIDYGGIETLVYSKAVGTLIACLAMIRLVYTRYRLAIVPIFLFQLCLFYYISFYTVAGFDRPEDFFHTIKLFFEFYQGKHLS